MYKLFIAFFLSTICNDALSVTTPERLSHMSAKLARKLTKLELEKEASAVPLQAEYNVLFSDFRKRFETTLGDVRNSLERTWKLIQQSSRKFIPALPTRASPQDMILSLANSGEYLATIMQRTFHATVQNAAPQLRHYSRHDRKTFQMDQAKDGYDLYAYLDLAAFEDTVASGVLGNEQLEDEKRAVSIKDTIKIYVNNAKTAYSGLPEQLSKMALCVMDLWIQLDQLAIEDMPLLADHPCPFPKDLMHIVQASTRRDMERVLVIEQYLAARQAAVKPACHSVFDDPARNCLAERVFDEDEFMQETFAEIEAKEIKLQQKKSREFDRLKAEYEELVISAASMSCLYERNEFTQVLDHNDHQCQKCYLGRCARRVKIQTHERLLPENTILANAIVFELTLPEVYACWRDSTWFILQELARPTQLPDKPPEVILQNYAPLSSFDSSADADVVFGSKTKSFLNTHYSAISLNGATLEKCLLNYGLKYGLYAQANGLWAARQTQQKPSFAELCRPVLGAKSPFVWLEAAVHPIKGVNGMTANDVLAWQTKCPTGMTILEGQSYLELRLGGHKLQWPRLLRELASTKSELQPGSSCDPCDTTCSSGWSV